MEGRPEKESGFLVGELDGRVSAAFDAVIAEVIIEGFRQPPGYC